MRQIFFFFGLVTCIGCSGLSPLDATEEAALSERTATQRLLEALPAPKQPLVLSVYSFDDQTGQTKPSELPQYSRAVTQGGLAILKGALLSAGNHTWFRVLERGGLEHLLKEREIIRAMRAQYKAPNGAALPAVQPMLYAGVLLEGGVVAYDSNLDTGGLGARSLGIGGSTTYRRDMVTVALRAVSVANGEVILSSLASKTVVSSGIQGGVFRYVSYDDLVEAEAGITKNEPTQLAVRQAIELAVYSLIMDGYAKGYWTFKDRAAGRAVYDAFVNRFDAPKRPVSSPADAAPPAETGVAPSSAAPGRPPEGTAGPRARTAVRSPSVSRASREPDERGAAAPHDGGCAMPGRLDTGADTGEPPDGYYYQIAAFPPEDRDGSGMIADLEREGLPLTLQRAVVAGAPYCRVLVGPYRQLSQALQAKTHIADAAVKCSGRCGIPFLRRIAAKPLGARR